MSAAVDLYIPVRWDHTIRGTLTAAGFEVTARDRSLPNGLFGREYDCRRGGEEVKLSRVPMLAEPDYLFVLGLARCKHASTLQRAQEALTESGALDEERYKEQRKK